MLDKIKSIITIESIYVESLLVYVTITHPDSYLNVLFYRLPFSDEYVISFPNEGWILIDLSCYHHTSIKHWIRPRVL